MAGLEVNKLIGLYSLWLVTGIDAKAQLFVGAFVHASGASVLRHHHGDSHRRNEVADQRDAGWTIEDHADYDGDDVHQNDGCEKGGRFRNEKRT